MADKKPHTTKHDQQVAGLTQDLQRTRADFENYRKRVEIEKKNAADMGATKAVLQLLPVIDTVERATLAIPADIAEHQWVKGVASMIKQLDKALVDMGLKRIDATEGVVFNPEQHQAIQFDDEAEGDKEVIAAELQPGYMRNGAVIRPALVKVTRR